MLRNATLKCTRDMTRWVAALGLLGGCGDVVLEEQSVAAVEQAILDGEIERGYPAVGNLRWQTQPENGCTGTLVSSEFVLSAAHCGLQWVELGEERAFTFSLGNDPSDFTEYELDAMYNHPNVRRPVDAFEGPYDLALFHVVVPEGVSPEAVSARERLLSTPVMEVSTELRAGEHCTAVGFGDSSRERVEVRDVRKRSATVTTASVGDALVIARQVTGIPFGGDSGGPLDCGDGKISAIVHGGADEPDPRPAAHRLEEYNRVDGWVGQFLATWAAGARPAPNPLVW